MACLIKYCWLGSSDDPAHQAHVQKVSEKSDMNISSNESYDVIHRDEGAEEIIYNYPQMNFDSTIEAQQNEAYATNIVTQGNEAYAASTAL
jgi:Zn-finger protein